jgi:hypothetical protein
VNNISTGTGDKQYLFEPSVAALTTTIHLALVAQAACSKQQPKAGQGHYLAKRLSSWITSS